MFYTCKKEEEETKKLLGDALCWISLSGCQLVSPQGPHVSLVSDDPKKISICQYHSSHPCLHVLLQTLSKKKKKNLDSTQFNSQPLKHEFTWKR